jgi:hypothetical protein
MNLLGTVGAVLAVVLYVALISLPGLGIAYLGWRFSRAMRPVSLQTLFRAGVLATAVTPSVYGHAGILPAIILVFVLHGHERWAGILPILAVWLIATPVIAVATKKRRLSDSSSIDYLESQTGKPPMKYVDYLCASTIFIAGVAAMITTEIRHPPHAVLDTPLVWILVAMINLLRLRNGYSVRNLRVFCIGANLSTLTLEVLRLSMFGVFGFGSVIAFLILAEALFSLVPLSWPYAVQE